MVVHPGESKVGERKAPKLAHGLLHRTSPGRNIGQKAFEGGLIHVVHYPARV
jgi:hypothetical protein